MMPRRYRKLVRFYQLKKMVADESVFDKEYVEMHIGQSGKSNVDKLDEFVKAEYAAVNALGISDVEWYEAFCGVKDILEDPEMSPSGAVQLAKFIRLGKELFENG